MSDDLQVVDTETQVIDDARRYVELARAGWRDPYVDPFELLAEVVEAAEMDRNYAAEAAREEAEEKADEQIAELREELDVDKQDVSTLLAALKGAIERETAAAAAAVRTALSDLIAARDAKIAAQGDELALLKAELRTLKDSLPTPTGKRRGVSPQK